METIKIEETKDTPRIILDGNKYEIEIAGTSYPENAKAIYSVVLDWIEKLDSNSNLPLKCSFYYDYISSSSKKMVYEVLMELDNLYKIKKDISIIWYHNEADEDMGELGDEFIEIMDVPIEIKEREDFIF